MKQSICGQTETANIKQVFSFTLLQSASKLESTPHLSYFIKYVCQLQSETTELRDILMNQGARNGGISI